MGDVPAAGRAVKLWEGAAAGKGLIRISQDRVTALLGIAARAPRPWAVAEKAS